MFSGCKSEAEEEDLRWNGFSNRFKAFPSFEEGELDFGGENTTFDCSEEGMNSTLGLIRWD
jgi:hypothetical protein